MSFFGESSQKIQYVSRNIGRKTQRATSSFWENESATPQQTKERTLVMNLYMSLLTCVAESVCGGEAAAASLDMFGRWIGSTPVRNTVAIVSKEKAIEDHLSTLAPVLRTTPKGSVERRVARAILCHSFRLREIRLAAERFPGLSTSRESYAKGRCDYDVLVDDGVLVKKTWSREKFEPACVDAAIEFVLSLDNVVFVSWGTKRVKLDGVIHDVPSIRCRKPTNVMYERYIGAPGTNSFVSKRTFYRLVSVLTHGEVQARTSVDYVTGFLLNDVFDVLKRMFEDLLLDGTEDLVSQLEVVKTWLKYGTYAELEYSGATAITSCPRHLIDFGLGEPTRDDERRVSCKTCQGFYAVLAHAESRLREAGADENTLSVLHDCYQKVELFLGHRIRVINQQRALHDLFENMKARHSSNGDAEALVVVDFKMKAEPMYFREKTVDHYGKRGMSWHGSMVSYWSKASGRIVENKAYFDHISSTDNKQDKEAVVALLEAMMMALKRDLPQISSIAVQSDNASSYQNSFVSLLLPIIGAVHRIQVSRYLHTDTQDGKSVLDAHFARAWKKVCSWVQQGNNCVTPPQLVAALSADGGITNSVAELVEYDRGKSRLLLENTKSIVKTMSSIAQRTNDVEYEFPVSDNAERDFVTVGVFDFRMVPSFKARLYGYSDVGGGIEVLIDPQSSTCTLTNGHSVCERGNLCGASTEGRHASQVEVLSDNMSETNDDSEAFELEYLVGELDTLNSGASSESCGSEEETNSEFLPSTSRVGFVTGVRLTTAARIRRRARKWHRLSRESSGSFQRQSIENPGPAQRDASSHAKRSLLEMKNAGKLHVITAAELSSEIERLRNEIGYDSCEVLPSLRKGWARRPQWGKMYGARYLKRYQADISEMFEQGEANSSHKLGPARMLEMLIAKYPNRYDLPSENDIRAEVSKLTRTSKKTGRDSAIAIDAKVERLNIGAPPTQRQRMSEEYSTCLRNLVAAELTIKPKIALRMFHDAFPSSDMPDDKITSKVSTEKHGAKKKNMFITPTKQRSQP